ncbi:MAG TPA: aminotransferase class I/II-fold pyridoxal phosphate-dependent enzyme [Patescibacteria group bacterium]|nr:aminotransferase class I/II-fold pyridoxal phosphate-dependent enzyme [Patescibacteria group bacterium]
MTSLLQHAFDSEVFRQQGHQLVDMLADYLQQVLRRADFPVMPWREPAELRREWQQLLADPLPVSFDELTEKLLQQSIHLHHPRCCGHQVAPPAPITALAELFSSLLNNSMAVYEVGPAGTAIEKAVLGWLAQRLGMAPGTDGILTSGGSLGNLTGLLAARRERGGCDAWEEGARGGLPMAVLVSEESHYSVARALKIMGLGSQGLIKLPVDDHLQVRPELLESALTTARARGRQVFAVVANACSTSTGAYDPLPEIGEFAKRNGLWFHVDAAHGGAACFSPKYRHLVRGLEDADSLVIDFHKMMLCPALATAVLFRDGTVLNRIFSQKASYLLPEQQQIHWQDIARNTIECTKKMMGLKVMMLLKTVGEGIFSEYITRVYDLSRDFAAVLQGESDFRLAVEPQANIVCFRHQPARVPAGQWGEYNAQLRRQLVAHGRFYIVQTTIAGEICLRLTLMNPFTNLSDLQELLIEIRHFGQRIRQNENHGKKDG